MSILGRSIKEEPFVVDLFVLRYSIYDDKLSSAPGYLAANMIILFTFCPFGCGGSSPLFAPLVDVEKIPNGSNQHVDGEEGYGASDCLKP